MAAKQFIPALRQGALLFARKCQLATLIVLCFAPLGLMSCTQQPPENLDNICTIFNEYPKWYWDAKKSEKRWGMPVSVQMAIMHQESHFNATAKPSRTKTLWIFPGKRPTTAYGYSQAVDGTWDAYKKSTGNSNASRRNFADATDFIGWYGEQNYRSLRISRSDAYSQYLAYHEGAAGYKRGSYKNKPWLIKVAYKVSARANLYQRQLNRCQGKIKRHWWY